MGITAEGIKNALPQSTQNMEFYDIGTAEPFSITGEAIRQRQKLVEAIRRKEAESDYPTAYKYILEEVAYTWFNRLIAVRFMEVNDYLPSHIRVLSSESGKVEPDLVTTPFDSDLDFTSAEEETILRLKTENALDELFRLLFIKQCNALNEILPALFEKTSDYTEVLLNLSVVDQEGVVYRLIHDIDEDDFNIEKGGQVEIIGWLYQYYNTEPKNAAFAKNGKITKDEIPAVTQLFTPDWIVRYMVQNSLGRLFIDKRKNEGVFADGRDPDEMTWDEIETKRISNEEFIAEQMGWRYYLPEAAQTKEVRKQLDEIQQQSEYKDVRDIKVIDPCMGSGHILVYAFDVLMQIYESAGYSQRDAAKSILEHNIYGLDIDDRAYQLAYFAVMMKARQYNRRILNGENTCHVYAIQESNSINCAHLKYFGAGMDDIEKNAAKMQLEGLLDTLTDAKEYGSILNVESYNWDLLRRFVATEDTDGQISMDSVGVEDTAEQLNRLIDIGETMARKYWVTCTNPPYAGTSNLSANVNNFVKKNYPDSKADLFAVFIERCRQMTVNNGFQAMITQHSWMFLSVFENLRRKLLSVSTVNMVHLGAHAFEEIGGEVVQTTSFILRGYKNFDYVGVYCRLVEPVSQYAKEEMFQSGENRFFSSNKKMSDIPGIPFAYWASPNTISAYKIGQPMAKYAPPKQGTTLGINDRFLRLWFETTPNKKKWFPCLKGGEYRKWYGNHSYVVNWENDGLEVKSTGRATVRNADKLFVSGISWSRITSYPSFRIMPEGYFFESASGVCFPDKENISFTLGLLNSCVIKHFAEIVNPTLTLQSGDVATIPVIEKNKESVNLMVFSLIEKTKVDWDSFESSWDFKKHPLLRNVSTISESFNQWQAECDDRFNQLKANEEELNRIFIDIYGLQDELTPEVEDKDVTVRKADLQRDIKSLLSYAVGCMFGRYSTYKDGLLFAGEPYSLQAFVDKMNDRLGTISDEELERAYRNEGVVVDEMFFPDTDNVIPITDEEYLDDDIVSRLCAWLKAVYGADTLEENLDYIAKALGNKGSTSREIIRNYFLNDFFKDHCQTYSVTGSGKRPIYWLFDSGKQNGFKALVYLHRYTPDTIGNLRIDYLHKMQRVYESEINRMQDMMDHSGNAREVAAASKRKDKLAKQLKECREYDEKISHLALSRIELDLDDGVKVNYRKLQTAQDGKFYEVLADSKNIMVKEKK